MNYYIRTDASAILGTGHLRRCLALAKEIKKLKQNVFFICQKKTAQYFNVKDFPLILLNDNLNQASDALECLRHISAKDKVIVDSYQLGAEWESNFKNLCVIDDLGREHVCNLLVDQNFNSERNYESTNANKLLGTKYCLLDSCFSKAKKSLMQYQDREERIFVCFGGGDTELYLRSFESINRKWPATIVAKQKYELNLLNKKDDFKYNLDSEAIANLMSSCQLSIGAGGTMNWERFSLGLPSIVIPIADNQKKISSDLAQAGYLILLKNNLSLENTLSDVVNDFEMRNEISKRCMELVDGRGVKRVASVLVAEELKIRSAISADSEKIFEWRNHELNRKFSLNKELIDRDTHNVWFKKALNASKLLIISQEQDLAVARFDFENEISEVSIYMVPGFHNYGLGLAVLLSAIKWFESNYPKNHLKARILPDNYASLSVFKDAGFDYTNEIGIHGELIFIKR